MKLGQVSFGHLVTLAKVMEISYARAVYDVARCAVAQLDRCDTGNCSSAVYRLPAGYHRAEAEGGGVGSINAQTRKAESEGGGVGSINAQTRKAESRVAAWGSINA